MRTLALALALASLTAACSDAPETTDPSLRLPVAGNGYRLALLPDGFAIAGSAIYTGTPGVDVAGYTRGGSQRFSARFPTSGDTGAAVTAVAVAPAGGVIVLTDVLRVDPVDFSPHSSGFAVMHIDDEGNRTWLREMLVPFSDDGFLGPSALAVAPDGRVVVGGVIRGTVEIDGVEHTAAEGDHRAFDGFIATFSASGAPEGLEILTAEEDDRVRALRVLAGGTLVVVTSGTSPVRENIVQPHTRIWHRAPGAAAVLAADVGDAADMVIDEAGGVIFTQHNYDVDGLDLARVDARGVETWRRREGGLIVARSAIGAGSGAAFAFARRTSDDQDEGGAYLDVYEQILVVDGAGDLRGFWRGDADRISANALAMDEGGALWVLSQTDAGGLALEQY